PAAAASAIGAAPVCGRMPATGPAAGTAAGADASAPATVASPAAAGASTAVPVRARKAWTPATWVLVTVSLTTLILVCEPAIASVAAVSSGSSSSSSLDSSPATTAGSGQPAPASTM